MAIAPSSTGPLDVDRLRADTPGSAAVAHLNNCGSALPPSVAVDTVVAHLRREAEIGGYEAAEEAEERISATRDSIGRLAGVPGRNVALVESATEGWDRVLSALVHTRPFRPGERVLVASAEYASNVLPLLQLARRDGVSVEFVPDGPDGALDPAALAAMLDDRVRLVAVTHAPSQNGLVNDVAAVGRLLAGAHPRPFYLVDACQSAGQLPLDLTSIGCDALTATGRKFLRGPRGTGFLAVSDAVLQDLEPFPLDLWSAGWEADGGYTVVADAQRFERFERSYAGVLGLGAAVDYALACGLDRLRDRIRALAEGARADLAAVDGVEVRDRGSERGGIVTFTVDGVPASEVVRAARAAGINLSATSAPVSQRDFAGHGYDSAVRLSPHAYNTEDEVTRAVEVVAELSRRAGGATPPR